MKLAVLRDVFVVLFLSAVKPSFVQAALIPVSVTRSVSFDGTYFAGDDHGFWPIDLSTNSLGVYDKSLVWPFDLELLDRSVYEARQQSTVSPTSVRATGSVNAIPGGVIDPELGVQAYDATATSELILDFNVNRVQTWRIAYSESSSGSGQVFMELFPVDATQVINWIAEDQLVQLTPGHYQLYLIARAEGSCWYDPITSGSASYDFSMEAVPEPRSALLVMAGLVFLGLRQSRRVNG